MPTKKKPRNKYIEAYRKERRRVQQFIRRASKRGYVFEDDILPQIPKRITPASIRRLEHLTPDELYKRAIKLDYETGEIVSAQAARATERQEAARKAAETRARNKATPSLREEIQARPQDYDRFPSEANILISNWYTELEALRAAPAYQLLKNWMGTAISQFGREAVADMLKTAYQNGYQLGWEVAYNTEGFVDYTNTLIQYIPDVGPVGTDEFWDTLEQTESWDLEYSPKR